MATFINIIRASFFCLMAISTTSIRPIGAFTLCDENAASVGRFSSGTTTSISSRSSSPSSIILRWIPLRCTDARSSTRRHYLHYIVQGTHRNSRLYGSGPIIAEEEYDDDGRKTADGQAYGGYNPFTGKYQVSSSSSSSSSSSLLGSLLTSTTTKSQNESSTSKAIGENRSSSNVISLRKTRMQEITKQLLDALTDESSSSVRRVLDANKEFLLELLEDQDAVLDSDSIYTPNMTRKERYETFKASMDNRIGASRNKEARAVLTQMRDYVLQFE